MHFSQMKATFSFFTFHDVIILAHFFVTTLIHILFWDLCHLKKYSEKNEHCILKNMQALENLALQETIS